MIQMGIYQHYKGKYYLVIGLARHSETGEIMVVYVPLYLIAENNVQMAVRPLKMFMGQVDNPGYGDAMIPRFQFIGGDTSGQGTAQT